MNQEASTVVRLQQALLELMDQETYRRIRVGDITDKANVVRQTFYTHFSSKDELLLSLMDDIFEDYFDRIEPLIPQWGNGKTTEEIYTLLYQTWIDNEKVLMKVINANIDDLIYRRFRRYIARVIGNWIRHNQIPVPDPRLLDYALDYATGTAFHVMLRWMRDGRPFPPEAMARFQTAMISGNLQKIF